MTSAKIMKTKVKTNNNIKSDKNEKKKKTQ